MVKNKQERFNDTLHAAKSALDSAGIPFHLHSGTALGAHREKKFIPHDEDIDLGVFAKDYNRKLASEMYKHGFEAKYSRHFGTLKHGKEYTFWYKNGTPLDIFLIYTGKHESKGIFWYASYLGICNKCPQKTCRWKLRTYRPVNIKFKGTLYKSVPKKTLIDMYGKDWKTPHKFSYDEGVEEGYYKGLIC